MPQIRGHGVKFKAPAVLSQEHLPCWFLCPCHQVRPSLSCSHFFWPIQKGKEWTFTIAAAAELTEGGHCCSPAPTAGTAAGPSLSCGAGRALLPAMGTQGSPLGKTARGGSAADPSHSSDSRSILHPLDVVASQSPVSFQAVSKVTGLPQPTFPAAFPLLVSNFRPVTPFPAWILSQEKRNEIFFGFLSTCR